MRTCPKCGAFYADDSLAFCLADGTPLRGVDPSSESWNQGSRVIEQKEQGLRKAKRTLRWRWVVASAMTTLMLSMVLARSFTVESTTARTIPPVSPPSETLFYKITGRVMFENKPLSSVKIKLEGSKLTSIWTDANGYYTFSDLRGGGSYLITPMASMNFTPSSRLLNDLWRDESADFFGQNYATPTPTPTPTPEKECSKADQISALKILRSFEPSWRRQIHDERAKIIRENVPKNIKNAEASEEGIEFRYSLNKPCAEAVVRATYTWRVSWPANPFSPAKSKDVRTERRYRCGKTSMWGCTLASR